jgi:hypothetical protein
VETLLVDFRLDRPTWFYLSLLLVVAVFFRFSRIWSLRNLDLILLLTLSPGLLFLDAGRRLGYAWLFGASAVILIRLLLDPLFDRRPRIAQNLNTAGLIFLLGACATFHVASILTTDRLPASAVRTADRADQLVHRRDASNLATIKTSTKGEPPAGPAATVWTASAVGLSKAVALTDRLPADEADSTLPVRIAAILAHAAVVSALIVLGWKLFGDVHVGVSMATLYLLLPCTAYNSAQVNHVLPCGLVLWAVVLFRRPFAAGGLLGLACGTLTFPIFLLPIWMTFYGRRNAIRFAAALAAVWIVLLGSVALTAADADSFRRQVLGMIDWSMLRFGSGDTTGAWAGIDGVYRMPVFVTFLVMIGWLCRWPKAKTVEPLLARSAAVIVGMQFWYPQDGGVYLLWYVPLLLVVMFRPTLTQLTAPPVGSWVWRREQVPAIPEEHRALASATSEPVRPLFR